MTRCYHLYRFDQLSTSQLYDILALRAEVFVLEQQSIYLDPDGYDRQALHLCLFEHEALIAYARLIPPGTKFEQASIGRVVIAKPYRGQGLGMELIRRALQEARSAFAAPLFIEAQAHLQHFYESHGFTAISGTYILDGILHVNMVQ